jgi:hypothetical protein
VLVPQDRGPKFGSLEINLARVSVWRKQEDNFLSEHTPFPGEEMVLKCSLLAV